MLNSVCYFYKWFICFCGRYPISLRSPERRLSQDTQRMTRHYCPQFAIGPIRDLASWHPQLSADLSIQTLRTRQPISCLTPPDSIPKTPPNLRSTEVRVGCLCILPVSHMCLCVSYFYLYSGGIYAYPSCANLNINMVYLTLVSHLSLIESLVFHDWFSAIFHFIWKCYGGLNVAKNIFRCLTKKMSRSYFTSK